MPLGSIQPAIDQAIGLETAQGLLYVSAWEPDLTLKARPSSKSSLSAERWLLGPFHVGTYSAVRSYLKAVEATNTPTPRPSSPRCAT